MWPLGSERNGLVTRSQAARAILLGTSCLFTAMLTSARAGGLPSGGVVVGGQAAISSPNSNSTVIDQSTDKAIINWQDFSIATGNSVRFNQPGANSIALNRVLGSTPSVINGDLFANGHVWLINGNGVLFGKGSQVSVGSLIATTADISNQDFMRGNYKFGSASANPNAAIVNNGSIHANSGGSVVLAGPVVANNGIIQADLGSVTLGGVSTFSVDFTGDNLLRFAVGAPVQKTPNDANGHPVKALVSNTGTISAKGGTVMMTTRAAESVVNNVINNSGMVEATSVAMKDGEVILDAGDGSVEDSGTVDVSGKGAGQTGGAITVEAKSITVDDNARMDASGDHGGGTILIGGDAHGQGAVRNAQTTTIGHATIAANAISSGNGGKVVVWSDGQTRFAGTISARGGALGGDGGFVETSGGHLAISTTARVETLAPLGKTGTWLLDPTDIVVQQGGEDGLTDGTDSLDHNPDGTDIIDPDTITNALSTTNVSLEASNDITVVDDILYSSTHSLSLLAEHSIDVLANIENTLASGGGGINLIAGWDGTTRDPAHFTDDGVFGNNAGSVTVGGDRAAPLASVGAASALVTVAGDIVTVDALGGDAQIGFHGDGGGDISVVSLEDVFVKSETGGKTALIGNGFPSSAGATGNINVNVGTILVLEAQQDNSAALIGNVSATGVTGDITVATGQYVFMNADGASSKAMIGSNTGTASGAIDVSSVNDSINLAANGADSTARIGNIASVSANGTISVTALGPEVGQVTLLGGGDGSTAAIGHAAAGGLDTAVPLAGAIAVQASGSVVLDAAGSGSYVQIGHHGAGGDPVSVNGDSLALEATGGLAQVGNGSMLSDIQGDVAGDLSVRIFDQSFFDSGETAGHTIVGNRSGSGGAISGNVIFTTGNVAQNTPDDELGNSLLADLDYGDVTLGMTGDSLTVGHDFIYDSPHNLTLLSSSNVAIEAMVQNQGSGSVTAIGGWDGTTVDSAHLLDSGVYGNGGGVFIGSPNTDPAFGSKSGTTTVAGGHIFLDASGGPAQIGYHGAGTGDINVISTGDLTLNGGGTAADYALIGNGSFGNGFAQNVSGDINIQVGGLTTLAFGGQQSSGGLAWIGNVSGAKAAGDVSLITGQFISYGSNADGIDPNTLGKVIAADLGTSDDTGGNFTFGLTNPDTDSLSTAMGGESLEYTSPHDLTILSSLNLTIANSIQNSGTGALTILAGWDPAIAPANVLTTPGAYGNNGAFVWVVGDTGSLLDYNPNSSGGFDVDSGAGVAIGSRGGVTTVGAAQIYIEGLTGYAQIGYHGDGGAGAINVIANGVPGTGNLTGVAACYDGNANICVIGGRPGASDGETPVYAQIGNLGMGVAGSSTADINVSASGNIAVSGGGTYGDSDGGVANAYGMIGSGDASRSTTQSVSGDINVHANGQLNFFGSSAANSQAWLGNRTGSGGNQSGNVTVVASEIGDGGTADVGQMVAEDLGTSAETGGDVTVGLTGDLFVDHDVAYASPHTLSLLSTDDVNIQANIQNSGDGDINVIAGWDGSTLDPAHFTDPSVFGNHGGSVFMTGNADASASVGSRHGLTTVAGDEVVLQAEGGGAQIGYHGAGNGNIEVLAKSELQLLADLLPGTDSLALIGNGGRGVTGAIGGSVSVISGGSVIASASGDGNLAIIGNLGDPGATLAGNTIIRGGTADGLEASMQNDLQHGDFTLELFDPNGEYDVNENVSYGSSYALNLLSAGSIVVGGSIQNAGDGNINLIAGWDGSTVDPSHFTDAGVFGNNHGAVVIDSGDVEDVASVGSKSGLTTVAGDQVLVGAGDGNAQIGYRGAADGNIDVVALTNIFVASGGTGLSQIGNGGRGVDSQVGGSITMNAGGALVVAASSDGGMAFVGNLGDGDGASESGHVSVAAPVVSVFAGAGGRAQIGNATLSGAGGAADGDIEVTANSLTISSDGANSRALIGDGKNNNTVHGDLTVDAGDILLFADGNNSFARIGHNPRGESASVEGNIVVNAEGDVVLLSGVGEGHSNATIGSGATGDVAGDLTLAANSISLNSAGDFSQTRIGNAGGGDVSGNTSVTAHGDILLHTGGQSALALITQQGDTVSGDILVRSLTGQITLDAAGDSSQVQIGESGSSSVEGEITIEALDAEGGEVHLIASGNNALSLIGHTGFNGDGTVPLTGAININVANALSLEADGSDAYAQIGGHTGGSSDIAITAGSLELTGGNETNGTALIGNGSFDDAVAGDVGGDISLRVAGLSSFNGTNGRAWIGNNGGDASGNVVFVTGDTVDNTPGDALGEFIAADLQNGDFTLGFTNPEGSVGPDHAIDYNSDHTFNVLSTGDIDFAGSIRNDGAGDINVVAGWNGETLDPTHFGDDGVFGNNGHGVTIGLTDNSQGDQDGVMLGSHGGTTSVFGDFLTLAANNGYAQLGYNGAGQGDLLVNVLGDVNLKGGDSTGSFAQIGNGGRQTHGSESGDITVNAGGDVALTGGSGEEAYVQIGHGGAESNTQSQGYGLSGLVTVTGENVTLAAGDGDAAYAQVGHGGFKVGNGLTGDSEINGNITITANQNVTLTGNGTDAYAQIGHGGDQMNTNAGADAHGAISGDIVVTAPNGANGSIDMTAGDGDNAYVQVGNGGYSINAPTQAIAANFTIGGNITISDLAITGGGLNGYGQIGNGDNSHTSYGDISGDIFINVEGGDITLTNGPGPNANANIHNATGHGTVTGSITGFTDQGGGDVDQPETQGTIVTLTNNPPPAPPPVDVLPDIILTSEPPPSESGESGSPNPIEEMSGGDDDQTASDKASESLGNSLDGGKKSAGQILLGGILKQQQMNGEGTRPKGVPSADEDFSSWGNEAYWQ